MQTTVIETTNIDKTKANETKASFQCLLCHWPGNTFSIVCRYRGLQRAPALVAINYYYYRQHYYYQSFYDNREVLLVGGCQGNIAAIA